MAIVKNIGLYKLPVGNMYYIGGIRDATIYIKIGVDAGASTNSVSMATGKTCNHTNSYIVEDLGSAKDLSTALAIKVEESRYPS